MWLALVQGSVQTVWVQGRVRAGVGAVEGAQARMQSSAWRWVPGRVHVGCVLGRVHAGWLQGVVFAGWGHGGWGAWSVLCSLIVRVQERVGALQGRVQERAQGRVHLVADLIAVFMAHLILIAVLMAHLVAHGGGG
jgi:hypothetical protein